LIAKRARIRHPFSFCDQNQFIELRFYSRVPSRLRWTKSIGLALAFMYLNGENRAVFRRKVFAVFATSPDFLDRLGTGFAIEGTSLFGEGRRISKS
jgi:hypothetical protein